MSIVLGNMSQIMTRYLSMDILMAYTCNSYIRLSTESLEQMKFWKKSIQNVNVRQLKLYTICSQIVYSDASQSGYAGDEVQSINGVAHGQWSSFESTKSSTWRLLKAVLNVILSLRGILAHIRIKWFTDYMSVCHIVEKGSMKRDLQDIATEIFSFCTVNCISLEIEWLPRTLNQQADYLSKVIDCNDWGLAVTIFNLKSAVGTF